MTFKDTISEIQDMLQKAIELEFATIPPYLTAAFSIPKNTNRDAFAIIHSIYMEEMLHLVLAANVLNAINGNVVLDKTTVPQYPLKLEFNGKRFKDRAFDVNLEKFSKNSIYTFMKIEMPEYLQEPKLLKAERLELEVPGYTIGEFYELIKDKLKTACDTFGETDVFSGDATKQIGEVYYWSGDGKAFEVTNLKTALEAIDIIVEQGEGVDNASILDNEGHYFEEQEEVAHYFRFNEIYLGRKYKRDDDPKLPPTGPVLPIDWESTYPIKTDCKTTDLVQNANLLALNQKFNMHFSIMVRGIEEALSGKRETLFSAIMNDMHQMAEIAYKMVQIPINGTDGEHGAPTFEILDLD